ncbi:glycerol-3-phosphate 1-O-acyltransferase PlsB [Halomonas organivorans]|uniref:Glycerol-3-phosphate acyltransferase n=1 Tax=Halomonas organivorans TaxID=257772 RepID=A0A7W5BXI0_9GAMM|nr:glycerol-3-phosphate 1-O-acyltransferase PlsB [Halomonas organivorans]MBB3140980.1 glycerol-3-phosphate O-acyltransferase [Halomonas organivorans]
MAFSSLAWRRPLRRLLAAWVRVRRIEPSPETLGLPSDIPTFYVLPRPALSDALLLEDLTERHALPSAAASHSLGAHGVRTLIALPAPRRRRRPTALRQLIDSGQDVQLVPVSVFWGRAPGKRFGVWHLLAADGWRLTGRLRRLLAVLVNGRDLEVHFGAPLRLSELIDGRDAAVIERKAARLLRVHFRRVRSRVLGPDLSHRRTLIEGVVSSPEVERTIVGLAGDAPATQARLRRRARRYGREIAANMSYPVLRFLDGLLGRLWNRLYDGVDVNGIERVTALAGRHTLVYVPCHRSHIDYLLLSYVLYSQGLMPPHIAAGRNLNMPLIGPLLRRGGAFFMRRSFRDQPLYARVFDEYLHRLLSRGHSLEYFIEGGRSRSGRLLTPRPGMLAMTLGSFLRRPASDGRPLSFVPVYIGYERILEEASYQRELGGGAKRKESPLALLGVLGRLKQPYGRVMVNVGEPLALDAFLDEVQPDWRQALGEPRPAWRTQAVSRLGRTLSRRINAAASLNPVNLVALSLLATPHRAIEAELLERQLALLADLRRPRPGDEGQRLPDGTPREWIDHARSLGLLAYRPHPLGDLVTVDERQAVRLSWYRNNVLHLFALTGLVAFAFRHHVRHHVRHRRDALESLLAPGWPVLVNELSIEPPAAFGAALDATLERLAEVGLLVADGHGWKRAEDLAKAEQLRMLGRLMRPSLERGYLLVAALLGEAPGHFDHVELANHARQLAERLAQLTGRDAPEFFDPRLFDGLVESLEHEGWLSVHDDHRLHYDESLREAARRSRTLFDPALRHRLERIAARGGDSGKDEATLGN